MCEAEDVIRDAQESRGIGDVYKGRELTITSAARSSGFPKMALFEDKLYWARTVLGVEKEEQFVEVCWR